MATAGRGRMGVGELLWSAQRLYERGWDEALSRVGVTRAEVAVLFRLGQSPGLSGSELARRTHLSVPGVAAMLARMGERGWVRRKEHPSHRRLLEVFLTPAGKRRLLRARQALRAVDARALKGMKSPQRAALQRALAHVVELLGPSEST